MQTLKEAFQYLVKLSERVGRYPNEVRTNAREGQEYELDNMILTEPNHVLNFFRFEYIMCGVFSLTALFITTWFLVTDKTKEYTSHFAFLYYWLIAGNFLHIVNVLTKVFIIRQLFKIPLTETLIVRRLMLLIRSNIFLWNERVSFIMYNFYILGMCKLACSNICGSIRNNVYRICYFIICSFLLRLANIFIRFMVEYYVFTRTVTFDTIINHGASAEEIADIPVEDYRPENMTCEEVNKQWCGICLEYFQAGDKVTKLPCAKQHYFHRGCTEKWLRNQNVCPYCRHSLRKPKK